MAQLQERVARKAVKARKEAERFKRKAQELEASLAKVQRQVSQLQEDTKDLEDQLSKEVGCVLIPRAQTIAYTKKHSRMLALHVSFAVLVVPSGQLIQAQRLLTNKQSVLDSIYPISTSRA